MKVSFFLLSLRCYFGLEDLEPYYALKHLFFEGKKKAVLILSVCLTFFE